MGQGASICGLLCIAFALHVPANQRTSHVGPVSVIGVAGRVVAVNGGVEDQDFSMIWANTTQRGILGPGISMKGFRIRGVSKTSMVGVQPAVGNPQDHTRSIQTHVPKRMFIH